MFCHKEEAEMRYAFAVIVLVALGLSYAQAQTPTEVKAIQYGTTNITNVNGSMYFGGSTDAEGLELWKSDGTTAGTALLKNINPGRSNSTPSRLTNVNGTVFFIANDGTHGTELWKTDGTANGTVLVKDIYPGSTNSNTSNLININGILYFTADDGTHGKELWKSDGTENGTVMVKDINPGSTQSNAQELFDFNGTLFFAAAGSGTTRRLWKSDGTEAGTVYITASCSTPQDLTMAGSVFFFAASGSMELWKSDGTDTGTVKISNGVFEKLVNLNDVLYFYGVVSGSDRELWKCDMTGAGLVLVKNVNPTGISGIKQLINANGTLFFTATDNTHGQELWKSDGTTDGTVLVKDIWPGSASGDPNGTNLVDELIAIGGTVYFSANDGTNGVELWKSDGTEAGTVMLEILAGSTGSSPKYFAVSGTTLYFGSYNSSGNNALMKLETSAGISSFPRGQAGAALTGSGSELFNMQGQKVQPANAGTGVYLMQDEAGQSLRKVMIVK
jgi:ELWxxDGT repeat protein